MAVEYAAMTSGLEDRFQNLHEIVKAAKASLPPGPWDYLAGATETETTMRRNRLAVDSVAFRPRVLRDVSNVDLTRTFLGKSLRLPVLTAPIGGLETFDPAGGAAVARATAEFGVFQMLSSVCIPGLEEVAKAADNARIFQLYVRGDRSFVDDHARRAIDHGYAGFTITVDTAHYSRRERDIATRFVKPWRQRATGMNYQAGMTWDLIKYFKDTYTIPLGLKGIATAEDAELCVQHGVDMVYVSNHGGRQLDHGRGSMDVLPEVLKAVNGRAKVIIDGGFTRGTDVIKAIAMGADMVGLGRLPCYGLAAASAPGVVRVLELLEDEMRICMGLLGAAKLENLDRSYLHVGAPMVREPHVLSSFPLIGEGY